MWNTATICVGVKVKVSIAWQCIAMHSPALAQIDVFNGSQQTIILSVDNNKMLQQVKQPNGWGS